MSPRLPTSCKPIAAPAMLVITSPTAMRAEHAASITASGVLSPMAIASPHKDLYAPSVTAQSATGICQGPTIWSCTTIPVMLRSPIVIRNDFEAIAGSRSSRSTASTMVTPARLSGAAAIFVRENSRSIFGGFPKSTCSGRSIAAASADAVLSLSVRCGSCCAVPITANGHRSRSQMASNALRFSGAIASTYRSCASLHHASSGLNPASPRGIAFKSKLPPHPPSLINSGNAFDNPPAPTS